MQRLRQIGACAAMAKGGRGEEERDLAPSRAEMTRSEYLVPCYEPTDHATR